MILDDPYLSFVIAGFIPATHRPTSQAMSLLPPWVPAINAGMTVVLATQPKLILL
jgi:hypothetical protein